MLLCLSLRVSWCLPWIGALVLPLTGPAFCIHSFNWEAFKAGGSELRRREKKRILKTNVRTLLPGEFSVPTLALGSSFIHLNFLIGVSSVVCFFPFLGILPCSPGWFQTQSLYQSPEFWYSRRLTIPSTLACGLPLGFQLTRRCLTSVFSSLCPLLSRTAHLCSPSRLHPIPDLHVHSPVDKTDFSH